MNEDGMNKASYLNSLPLLISTQYFEKWSRSLRLSLMGQLLGVLSFFYKKSTFYRQSQWSRISSYSDSDLTSFIDSATEMVV